MVVKTHTSRTVFSAKYADRTYATTPTSHNMFQSILHIHYSHLSTACSLSLLELLPWHRQSNQKADAYRSDGHGIHDLETVHVAS